MKIGLLTAVVLLGSCAARSGRPATTGAPFARLGVEDVLTLAPRSESQSGLDPDLVRSRARAARVGPAFLALWDTVKAAEAKGLAELYGLERFAMGEPGYDAFLFVRLKDGRAYWLFADDEDQEHERPRNHTVPAWSVGAEQFEALRLCFAKEFPRAKRVDLANDVAGGAVSLFHRYDGKETDAVMCLEPRFAVGPGLSREELRAFMAAMPTQNLERAIWAAIPPDVLPREDEVAIGWYGDAPGLQQRMAQPK